MGEQKRQYSDFNWKRGNRYERQEKATINLFWEGGKEKEK